DSAILKILSTLAGAQGRVHTVESNIAGSLSVRFFDVYKPIIAKAPTPNPHHHANTPKHPKPRPPVFCQVNLSHFGS
ncbi:hypothetical protein, partial [Mobiluncus mulieris]|uniref:hypothetical protein n=1 Tax=Mobiluncus mulieris TaxID=2052 RepID=UPI0021E33674